MTNTVTIAKSAAKSNAKSNATSNATSNTTSKAKTIDLNSLDLTGPKAMADERLKALTDLTASYDVLNSHAAQLEELRHTAIEAGKAYVALFPSLDDALAFYVSHACVGLSDDAKRKAKSRFKTKLATGQTQSEADRLAKRAYDMKVKRIARQTSANMNAGHNPVASKGGQLPSEVIVANGEASSEVPFEYTLQDVYRSLSKRMASAFEAMRHMSSVAPKDNATFAFALSLVEFSKTIASDKQIAGRDLKAELSALCSKQGY